MATVKRVPIEPVEEVIISLTAEEAVTLKRVIGCVSVPSDRPRQTILSIYNKLGEIGINFTFGERLPHTQLRD